MNSRQLFIRSQSSLLSWIQKCPSQAVSILQVIAVHLTLHFDQIQRFSPTYVSIFKNVYFQYWDVGDIAREILTKTSPTFPTSRWFQSQSFHLPWFHDPKNTSWIKTIKLPTVKYTAFSWYYVLPRSKCAMQNPVLKSHAPTIHFPYIPAYFPVLKKERKKESRLMRTPCRLCVSVCHRSQRLKHQPIFTNLKQLLRHYSSPQYGLLAVVQWCKLLGENPICAVPRILKNTCSKLISLLVNIHLIVTPFLANWGNTNHLAQIFTWDIILY